MQKLRYGLWLGCLLTLGCGDCDDENNSPGSDMSGGDLSLDMMRVDMDESVDMDMPEDMNLASKLCTNFEDKPGTFIQETINGQMIQVDTKTGAWQVGKMRAPDVCVKDADGQWRATVKLARGEMFYRERFGSYRFRTDVNTVKWLTPTGKVDARVEDGKVIIAYDVSEASTPLELVIEAHKTKDVKIQMRTSIEDVSIASWSTTCDANEGFFGLGSQTFGMSLRGGTYPLWSQEHGIGKPEDGGFFPINNIPEAAHAPMGIWHSSAGYTALVTHDGFSRLDLCETHKDATSIMSYRAMPGVVVISEGTALERLSHAVTTYLGTTTEPPAWIFAPWNDAVGGSSRLSDVASTLRANGIPSSAVWSEDWIGGEQTMTGYRLSYAWEWDPQTYPRIDQDIEALHMLGFAFLAYFNTFVPEPTRMFQEGKDGDYLIKNKAGEIYTFQDPAFRQASLVDLTNPAAKDWLKGYMVKAAGDLKIDGWMADFSEWMPVDAVLHSGQDAWGYHNIYPIDFQKVNREAMEQVHTGMGEAANNWTFFARSGWASANGGTPSQVATMWGADQDTDWDYDDGYPTTVPIGANLGLSGVPFFGTDVAGYTSIQAPNTNKELFYRWSMVGAFHPLMRTHHGSDECGNWNFDRDEETLAHYKRYASIHTLLYPYFQTLMYDALEKGHPIIRHPFLYSDSPAMWAGKDYVYFLGEHLLVAPVFEEGGTKRIVPVPQRAAMWWPLLGSQPGFQSIKSIDGQPVEHVTIDAPATEIPVFVKPGTILPLLAEVVDSFYGTQIDQVTDLEDVKGRYKLGLYHDAQGSLSAATFGAKGAQVTVSGKSWMMNTALTAGLVSLDGMMLPACDTVDASASCYGTDRIRVVGKGGMLSVDAGGSRAPDVINIAAETNVTLTLFIGGEVFGDLRAPTTLTDLDPENKPNCESD